VPIRPSQLCADGVYQLRLGVLGVPLIMVPDTKEGNAGIGLAHNSYHLVHQASEKVFKENKEVANASGLALCYW
jgi:hypothetical protein